MAHSDVRHSFTLQEAEIIRELTRQKLVASKDEQKKIRRFLRDKLGFYWDDYNPPRTPFNLETLEQLFRNGTLKIIGDKTMSNDGKIRDAIPPTKKPNEKKTGFKGRKDSDEYYVIDLCDEVLGRKAERQKRFDFLKGDKGNSLPVDAYYKDLNLVIEYHERQHTEEVKFFDNKQTVSGVSRGEQRKIYDERRKEVLPKHGIKLLIISYSDFGDSKILSRNYQADLEIVKNILKDYIS